MIFNDPVHPYDPGVKNLNHFFTRNPLHKYQDGVEKFLLFAEVGSLEELL
jgi:hypothetical protein